MTLWNKVKTDMKKGMKKGVSVLREGSNVAAEKAGQLAEMGKVRYQIFLLEQKVEKNFSEMGKRIYQLIEEKVKNPAVDPIVRKGISEAKKLEKKLKTLHDNTALLRKKVT